MKKFHLQALPLYGIQPLFLLQPVLPAEAALLSICIFIIHMMVTVYKEPRDNNASRLFYIIRHMDLSFCLIHFKFRLKSIYLDHFFRHFYRSCIFYIHIYPYRIGIRKEFFLFHLSLKNFCTHKMPSYHKPM